MNVSARKNGRGSSELLAVLRLAEKIVQQLQRLSSLLLQESDRGVVRVLEEAEAVVMKSRWRMTYSLALEKSISLAPSVFVLMEVLM